MNRVSLIILALLSASVSTALAEGPPAATSPTTRPAKLRKDVDAEQFDKLRQEKQNVVLDVRTPREFERGHVPGAVNVNIDSPDFEQAMKKMEPGKTYLVYCAAGVRSARACDKLERMEFKSLYNLLGGMKEWEKAAKPVEK
jgi:rhodanese-related sulfurtransferase